MKLKLLHSETVDGLVKNNIGASKNEYLEVVKNSTTNNTNGEQDLKNNSILILFITCTCTTT